MEYENLTFEDYISSNTEQESVEQEYTNLRGNFGCCSKYKQCSLSGKCLQSDDVGKACLYKEHLEKGEIYYSKASPNFSQEKYDEIENHFQSLSVLEKEAFLELVGFVIYVRPCIKHFLCAKKGDNFENVYSCMENSGLFTAADSHRLVRMLFEKKELSCKNCQVFCDKYSDIPFSTAKIELTPELEYINEDFIDGTDHIIKNLTKKGKEKYEKQIEYRLNKWKEFFLTSGTSVLNKFSDFYAYIDFLDNSIITTEEWAEDHKDIIPQKLSDLKYIAISTTDKEGKIINSFKKMECFERVN